MSGPHEPRKSMYERPSTSSMRAPTALATKNGVPPTPRNARTGLFTPPGISRWAEWKSDSERVMAPFASARRAGDGELDGQEVAARRVPGERIGGDGPARQHRDHHVHRVRIRGLAAHQGIALVGLREVRPGVDVRVIDGRHAVPFRFAAADGEQIARVDVVRGPSVARMPGRI